MAVAKDLGVTQPVEKPIGAAYEVAKQVYIGTLSVGEGANRLHAESGFNVNSARQLIMVFRQLMRGETFKRGLSGPHMDYYLDRIGSEFGPVVLRTALSSLWLHLRYYEGVRNVTMNMLRGVAAKHQALASTSETFEELQAAFDESVVRASKDTSLKRLSRLRKAPKIPARVPVVVFAFERNPDVVVEVLLRAKGKCARCRKAAPFLRQKDGSPYLEVHHLVQLADGGEDTVENAAALCPNCHRDLHYGVNTRPIAPGVSQGKVHDETERAAPTLRNRS
jgi:5-methylcytosine-specific restriction protein A